MKLRMILFAVLLSGCASVSGTSGPQIELPININNNLIPPSSLSVYLVPRSGIEHNLGTIIGSGRHTVYYRGLPPSGDYQLAVRADTRAMMSNVIVLDKNVKAIDWDLQRNYLQLSIQE